MEQKPEGKIDPLAEGALRLTHVVTNSSDTQIADELVKKLRWELERYRAVVMASAQVILTASSGGMVEEDVLEWRTYTGQTFEEMRGQGWTNALHPDER